MSLSYEITVHCDRCFHWVQHTGTTAKLFRRALKRRGWTQRGKKDFCPECSKEGTVDDR